MRVRSEWTDCRRAIQAMLVSYGQIPVSLP
jgi:hypothetical protein